MIREYKKWKAEQCKVAKSSEDWTFIRDTSSSWYAIKSLINKDPLSWLSMSQPAIRLHMTTTLRPDQYWPNLACREYEEVNLSKKYLAATLIDKPHQFSLLPLFCNYSAARLIATAELRTHASFAVRSSAALRNMNMIYTGSECALYAVSVCAVFPVCGVCVTTRHTEKERERGGNVLGYVLYVAWGD